MTDAWSADLVGPDVRSHHAGYGEIPMKLVDGCNGHDIVIGQAQRPDIAAMRPVRLRARYRIRQELPCSTAAGEVLVRRPFAADPR